MLLDDNTVREKNFRFVQLCKSSSWNLFPDDNNAAKKFSTMGIPSFLQSFIHQSHPPKNHTRCRLFSSYLSPIPSCATIISFYHYCKRRPHCYGSCPGAKQRRIKTFLANNWRTNNNRMINIFVLINIIFPFHIRHPSVASQKRNTERNTGSSRTTTTIIVGRLSVCHAIPVCWMDSAFFFWLGGCCSSSHCSQLVSQWVRLEGRQAGVMFLLRAISVHTEDEKKGSSFSLPSGCQLLTQSRLLLLLLVSHYHLFIPSDSCVYSVRHSSALCQTTSLTPMSVWLRIVLSDGRRSRENP